MDPEQAVSDTTPHIGMKSFAPPPYSPTSQQTTTQPTALPCPPPRPSPTTTSLTSSIINAPLSARIKAELASATASYDTTLIRLDEAVRKLARAQDAHTAAQRRLQYATALSTPPSRKDRFLKHMKHIALWLGTVLPALLYLITIWVLNVHHQAICTHAPALAKIYATAPLVMLSCVVQTFVGAYIVVTAAEGHFRGITRSKTRRAAWVVFLSTLNLWLGMGWALVPMWHECGEYV